MVADYLNNNPGSKVEIKGYASVEGSQALNEKLAAARAEAVKNMLVKTYKIDADRIIASGQGETDMFKETSWNRVSICTVK